MAFWDDFWDAFKMSRGASSRGLFSGRSQLGRSAMPTSPHRSMAEAILGTRRPTPPRITPSFGSRDPGLQPFMGVDLPGLESFFAREEEKRGREDLFNELLRLQDPSRYYMEQGELERQARAAAEAQYNPLIAALQQQMGAARRTATGQKRELGEMFGALSTGIRADIPEIEALYGRTKERTGEEFEELESGIQERYAKSQADQEAMLKRLNIEAAAPDILPEQMADKEFFAQLAAERGSQAEEALGREERGATEFTRSGAQMARLEGTQRQADLMDQLREILGGLQGQVGAHEAARAQATTAGIGQLTQQMQQAAQARSQQEFQNRMSMLQYERQLSQDEFDRLQQQQEAAPGFEGPVKSIEDLPLFLQGSGLTEQDQSEISRMAMDLSEIVRQETGGGALPPNKWQIDAIIAQEIQRRGWTGEKAAAARAALSQLGGLR